MKEIKALIEEIADECGGTYHPENQMRQEVVNDLMSLISMVQEECAKACNVPVGYLGTMQYCAEAVRALDFNSVTSNE